MAAITTKEPSDLPLLQGLLVSDAPAVRQLYDTVLPGVILDVRRAGGEEGTARDLFQEALLALYRRLQKGDFTLTCTLKSYLRVVCRNLYRKRLRDRGREAALPELHERVDLDPLMQERLERSEREQLFWAHFERLEAGCRAILRAFFAGDSLRFIAEQRGSTENYIKKRKSICQQHLTKSIRADPRYTES